MPRCDDPEGVWKLRNHDQPIGTYPHDEHSLRWKTANNIKLLLWVGIGRGPRTGSVCRVKRLRIGPDACGGSAGQAEVVRRCALILDLGPERI